MISLLVVLLALSLSVAANSTATKCSSTERYDGGAQCALNNNGTCFRSETWQGIVKLDCIPDALVESMCPKGRNGGCGKPPDQVSLYMRVRCCCDDKDYCNNGLRFGISWIVFFNMLLVTLMLILH